MLLFFMAVSWILFGSSACIRYEDTCYGSSYRIPMEFTPRTFLGTLYFTPSNGGPRIQLTDNGQAKDTRVEVGYYKVIFKDVRENGRFSIQNPGQGVRDIIELEVRDCSTKIRKYYGGWYYFNVPNLAEYLEFTPTDADLTLVLWNRTNPQGNLESKGRMKPSSWELTGLTQSDNGHYSFRAKDNTLLSRIKLNVQGRSEHYESTEGERLIISHPHFTGSWTITFTPEGENYEHLVVRNGEAVTVDRDLVETSFENRLESEGSSIIINPVELKDAGTFVYRDQHNNLAQTVTLNVEHGPTSPLIYVATVAGFVFVVIACCCCVKKCCCKKSSSKRDHSAPAAVYHHGPGQSGGPTYSAAPAAAPTPDFSYRPKYPPALTKPATTSTMPLASSQINIHVNPLQPEVAPTAMHRDAPAPAAGQHVTPAPAVVTNHLVSDDEPEYKLKGKFFSAPPLDSDSTFCDVYTSKKLNFR